MTQHWRAYLPMTHGYRNDGEPGSPQCLAQRLPYSWRKEMAQTACSVHRDREVWKRTGILPDYVKQPNVPD